MKKTADGSKWRKGVREGFDREGNVVCQKCFQTKLLIDELREENKALKAKVKKLEQGDIPAVIGPHTPSSQVPFKGKTKASGIAARGGAQVGHSGKGRKSFNPESADTVVEIAAPQCCKECQAELRSHSERRRSVLDAVELRVQKIVYKVKRGQCPQCKKLYESRLPVFRGTLYGNALISQVANMHYLQGIPIGRICDMLGPEVNPGSIFSALQRISKKWEPALESLIREYRKAPVKHADETGWRVDGQPGWSWLFCTPMVSIFECQDSRGSRVPKRIFGADKLPGVLIVDRFSAYNKLPCQLQYCYAHLLREVKKLDDEFPEEQEVTAFTSSLAHFLSEAMRLPSRPLSDQEYYLEAKAIAAQIRALVYKQTKHQGIESVQRIFTKQESRLFQWVLDRRVPAHNNRAERELRQTVIARKVSFGSQSQAGAKTRSILMSILATAKKRLGGISPETWFKEKLDQLAQNPAAIPADLIPP